MTRLHLSLNRLAGPIPTAVGSSRVMFEIHLYNNQLSGCMPDALRHCKRLNTLYLEYNDLSGTIPTFAKNSGSDLYLNNNKFSGTIPDGLVGFEQRWYINGNQLAGTFPRSMTQMHNLRDLVASDNLLEGTVPRLSQLIRLIIAGRQVPRAVGLQGTLPTCLGRSLLLTDVVITHQKIGGIDDMR